MPSVPLTPEQRAAFFADHPDWGAEGDAAIRTYVFPDFSAAVGFVARVALAAEAAHHHPDIDVRWNRVTLRLTTHSAGTLTDLDRKLAETIDGFLDQRPLTTRDPGPPRPPLTSPGA